MVFLTIGLRLAKVVMINEFINADLCQTYDSACGIALQGPISFVSSECFVLFVFFLRYCYESGKAERFVLSFKIIHEKFMFNS